MNGVDYKSNQQCRSECLGIRGPASSFGGNIVFTEERFCSSILIFQGHQNSRRDPKRVFFLCAAENLH